MQTDVLAPPTPPTGSATTEQYLYAASGNELITLEPQLATTRNSTVTSRVAIIPADATEQDVVISLTPIEVEARALPVRCGLLRTFRARYTAMSKRKDRLVVIGSATACLGVDPDTNSPRIQAAQHGPAAFLSKTYYGTALRPFPTTIAVVFDLSSPGAPAPISILQVEGHFERMHFESDFLWLFTYATTHQPFDPNVLTDASTSTDWSALDDSQVMPVSRTRKRTGAGGWASWDGWNPVAQCNEVQHVSSGSSTAQQLQQTALLVAAAMPLVERDGRKAPLAVRAQVYIAAWDPDVRSTLRCFTSCLRTDLLHHL